MKQRLALLVGLVLMGGTLLGVFYWRHPDRVAEQPWLVDDSARADDQSQLREALDAAPKRDAQGPRLVLVALDGWSVGDRLPALDGMETGTLLSCEPNSASAQACLLTGLPASRHGVYRVKNSQNGLKKDTLTLAQGLSAQGWRTVGVSAERRLRPSRTGLARGFDVYLGGDLRRGKEKLDYSQADRMVDLALDALAQTPGRSFVYLHLGDGRLPWIARVGFSPGEIDAFFLPEGGTRSRDLGWKQQREILAQGGAPDPSALRTWRRLRQAEWAYVNAQLERLLAALDPQDQVVVVSTVGTELPGQLEVGGALVDAVVQVPVATRGLPLDGVLRQDQLTQALAAQHGVRLGPAALDSGVVELHRGSDLLLLLVDGQERWVDDPHKEAQGPPELVDRALAWRQAL